LIVKIVACSYLRRIQIILTVTQVCRNINQIKICMETGRSVILLNLENLYESLYDVLNQVLNWMELIKLCVNKIVFQCSTTLCSQESDM